MSISVITLFTFFTNPFETNTGKYFLWGTIKQWLKEIICTTGGNILQFILCKGFNVDSNNMYIIYFDPSYIQSNLLPLQSQIDAL